MSRATYPLKLPASIKAAAARLAKEDGVSLNQWIATAVAQKIGGVETAAEFFKRRAGGAQPGDLKAFLESVPDVRQSAATRFRSRFGQIGAAYRQSVRLMPVIARPAGRPASGASRFATPRLPCRATSCLSPPEALSHGPISTASVSPVIAQPDL